LPTAGRSWPALVRSRRPERLSPATSGRETPTSVSARNRPPRDLSAIVPSCGQAAGGSKPTGDVHVDGHTSLFGELQAPWPISKARWKPASTTSGHSPAIPGPTFPTSAATRVWGRASGRIRSKTRSSRGRGCRGACSRCSRATVWRAVGGRGHFGHARAVAREPAGGEVAAVP
jgi:hypothetical protein